MLKMLIKTPNKEIAEMVMKREDAGIERNTKRGL